MVTRHGNCPNSGVFSRDRSISLACFRDLRGSIHAKFRPAFRSTNSILANATQALKFSQASSFMKLAVLKKEVNMPSCNDNLQNATFASMVGKSVSLHT